MVTLLLRLLLVALAGADPAAAHAHDDDPPKVSVQVESGDLRLEFDRRMWSRVVARTAAGEVTLGELQPTEVVRVGGREVTEFELRQSRRTPIKDGLGAGQRIDLQGTNPQLGKRVTLTVYDDFPGVVTIQSRYTVMGDKPLTVQRWTHRRFIAAGAVEGAGAAAGTDREPFWSYQPGSYSNRPDWVRPLRRGFTQQNFLGMNASDYGGGTPVVDVWRRDVGLAVGHLEPGPRLVSLPVRMPTAAGAELAIEEQVDRTLQPGESVDSLRSFLLVHTGDHFAGLARYRKLMFQLSAVAFPIIPESAYEPIWCGWGYGRKVTAGQITGTLAKAAELGFTWAVLDDGWQTAEGDWRLDPRKFPGGDADMKRLTDAIRAAGMKPMLWWAPLAADPGRQLLRAHPEYLLRDARGKPVKITWWNAQYLCPAYPPVQEYTRALVTKFIGDWGFEGLKLDGQHLNAAPPCHNPAHQHERPAEAFERTPELFRAIQEAAAAANPQAVLELCPCGTAYAFHSMPYLHLAVASDPESSWQIRHKGKTLKALIGPSAPYFGDHVELSDGGDDFASTVGVGGVVGTQFTLPSLGRSERKYHLTAAKEASFRKWVALYREQMLSRGEYLGELYDLGFDRPEAHAIRKDGRMYYAFYAKQFDGQVELRGLPEGRSCVRDYVGGVNLGEVVGPRARLAVKFQRHLLLEASARPDAGCPEPR
jgi:alpha-galactosidase